MTDHPTHSTTQARHTLPPVPWLSRVVLPVALGTLLTAAVFPLDKPISNALRALNLPGDLQREIQALHQFGGVGSIIVVVLVIALLQPTRVRRTLDWILCAATGSFLFNLMKGLIGRARPRLDDPDLFRPVSDFLNEGVTYNFASFPSTHTTHAVIAAVFLTAYDRRLRFLVWPLVALVMFGRVHFGAHWPSDTLFAAGIAYAWASLWVHRYWGIRLLDFLWKIPFRDATPKFPEVYEREAHIRGRDLPDCSRSRPKRLPI